MSASWLEQLISTKTFIDLSKEYIEIHKLLYDEDDVEIRKSLHQKANQLIIKYSNILSATIKFSDFAHALNNGED